MWIGHAVGLSRYDPSTGRIESFASLFQAFDKRGHPLAGRLITKEVLALGGEAPSLGQLFCAFQHLDPTRVLRFHPRGTGGGGEDRRLFHLGRVDVRLDPHQRRHYDNPGGHSHLHRQLPKSLSEFDNQEGAWNIWLSSSLGERV